MLEIVSILQKDTSGPNYTHWFANHALQPCKVERLSNDSLLFSISECETRATLSIAYRWVYDCICPFPFITQFFPKKNETLLISYGNKKQDVDDVIVALFLYSSQLYEHQKEFKMFTGPFLLELAMHPRYASVVWFAALRWRFKNVPANCIPNANSPRNILLLNLGKILKVLTTSPSALAIMLKDHPEILANIICMELQHQPNEIIFQQDNFTAETLHVKTLIQCMDTSVTRKQRCKDLIASKLDHVFIRKDNQPLIVKSEPITLINEVELSCTCEQTMIYAALQAMERSVELQDPDLILFNNSTKFEFPNKFSIKAIKASSQEERAWFMLY
jgi:hypothetical protein